MLGSYQDHIRNMLGPGQDHVGTMLGAMDNIRTRRHKICAITMFLCAITTLEPSEFFVSHIYTYIYIHVSSAEVDCCRPFTLFILLQVECMCDGMSRHL